MNKAYMTCDDNDMDSFEKLERAGKSQHLSHGESRRQQGI